MERQPCFENILKILRKKVPERPTLFEFFLNDSLYEHLAGEPVRGPGDYSGLIKAFTKAGYDYTTLKGSDFEFPSGGRENLSTVSLNEGALILSREDFEGLEWNDPEDYDYSRLEKCAAQLPKGMKIIIWGPGGVLENVIGLTGYDKLCFMLADDLELVRDIFDAVGSRLVKYYEICAAFDTVGALISNDDWGFNTQTMLSPAQMREFVFPWHKKIVEAIHKTGKPAILHSCGNLKSVMDDIIYDMCYDGKHSYEDNILPVEKAYDELAGKIAVLGGIDLDFICRETPENITKRCRAMVKKGMEKGGYALGSGNSIPYYVPFENYFAMINAALQ